MWSCEISIYKLQLVPDMLRFQFSWKLSKPTLEFGKEGNFINYVKGANIGGFIKVADAMLDQGVV